MNTTEYYAMIAACPACDDETCDEHIEIMQCDWCDLWDGPVHHCPARQKPPMSLTQRVRTAWSAWRDRCAQRKWLG